MPEKISQRSKLEKHDRLATESKSMNRNKCRNKKSNRKIIKTQTKCNEIIII